MTTTGHWIGSVDYMAPEQLRAEPVDARTDVYALGGVLHAALTGEAPFSRGTVPQTIAAHLNDPPPRPTALAPVDPAFDAVVARALAKDPADRYRSAGDLGRAAQAAARGERVTIGERTVARGPAAPSEDVTSKLPPASRSARTEAIAPAAASSRGGKHASSPPAGAPAANGVPAGAPPANARDPRAQPASPMRDDGAPPRRAVDAPRSRDVDAPPRRDLDAPATRDPGALPASPARNAGAPPAPARNAGAPPAPARNAGAPPAPARNAGAPPAPARGPGAPPAPARNAGAPPAPARGPGALPTSSVRGAGARPSPGGGAPAAASVNRKLTPSARRIPATPAPAQAEVPAPARRRSGAAPSAASAPSAEPVRRHRSRRRVVLAIAGLLAIAAAGATAGILANAGSEPRRVSAYLSADEVRSAAEAFAAAYGAEDAEALRSTLARNVQRVAPDGGQTGRQDVLAVYRRQFAAADIRAYDLEDLGVKPGAAGRVAGSYTVRREGRDDIKGRVAFGVVREGARPKIALIATQPD